MSEEIHFQPAQRQIFRYDQGDGKIVACDPWAVKSRLSQESLARGTTIKDLIDSVNRLFLDDPTLEKVEPLALAEAHQASTVLAEIVAVAFELVPFDKVTGTGATKDHAIGLLHNFNVWQQKKNRHVGTPPTSTPPSESTSAIPATTATSSVSA